MSLIDLLDSRLEGRSSTNLMCRYWVVLIVSVRWWGWREVLLPAFVVGSRYSFGADPRIRQEIRCRASIYRGGCPVDKPECTARAPRLGVCPKSFATSHLFSLET